jgi:hypothetical protein
VRCLGEIVRWAAWLLKVLFRQRRHRGFLHRLYYKRIERWMRPAAAAAPIHS